MSYRYSPGNGKGRKRKKEAGTYLDEFLFCTWTSKVHNNPQNNPQNTGVRKWLKEQ